METSGKLKKALSALSSLLKKYETQARTLKATEAEIAKAQAELFKVLEKPGKSEQA